tara:strand:+ start:704 stop:1084 length:381 start_codon:yes stop_codon:yes gene_type:complete
MKQELQDRLFLKYPEIFRQKDLSPQETCMCWGICVPDEWYDLLDVLCFNIQRHVDNRCGLQVEAGQVKTKFGGLRFYIDNRCCEYVDGLIAMAEGMSYTIKEDKSEKYQKKLGKESDAAEVNSEPI